MSDKVDVDVEKVVGNSFQDNVKFGSQALQHETSDVGIPILDQPLYVIVSHLDKYFIYGG